jgi:hypothetical protein
MHQDSLNLYQNKTKTVWSAEFVETRRSRSFVGVNAIYHRMMKRERNI